MRSTAAVSAKPAVGWLDRRRLALFAVRYGLFLALGLWIVFMAMASEHFLSWLNFLNVARQASPVVIVAIGMTFVMATAGIDLSVGSLVALVSVLSAAGLTAGLPIRGPTTNCHVQAKTSLRTTTIGKRR